MFHKLHIPSFLLVLIITPTLWANDAPLKLASGSAAVRQEGETDVVMRSECVRIHLGKDKAIVDASFEFYNEGDTTSITVGFPFYGMGYVSQENNDFTGARLGNFETWVNGKPCIFNEVAGEMKLTEYHLQGDVTKLITNGSEIERVRRTIEEEGLPETTFVHETRWLAKEVTFPANEITTTHVRYSAEYCLREINELEYMYGTGAGWRGPIGVATFVVISSPEMWLEEWPFTMPMNDPSRIKSDYERKRIGDCSHQFVFRNLEPENNAIFTVFADDRFQPFVSPFVYPDKPMSERPVTDDDLDLLSLHQLRLFENYYLAIHGKKLRNPELMTELIETCFVPPSVEQKTPLTPLERDNIKKIRAYEKKLRKKLSASSESAP